MSAAVNDTYEQLLQMAIDRLRAAGIDNADDTATEVIDAIWPDVALIIRHYEVVLANASVKLGSLGEELQSQIIGEYNR